MRKALLLGMLLSSALPMVTHAEVSIGVNVPGLSLHVGDRDARGYYWDGDYWREPPRRHRHHHHYAPPQYAQPPRGYYYGPPPREWHSRPHYRMPPPGYYYRGPKGPRR
ncbi:DUF2502 domain-containing protein [Serratia sp. DD3]|uniref:DUF2502 domain-containing protein n=1 Tax=Serratia sp. DD3 TaxID=1410619 RepID=UPI0003C50558|nr:DUF2502 domain-containing protein [Serratia sp. DD3]KEY60125.1 hypothetical protein SRDD_09790 [Serratia sp. DD3]